jgi:hypothetical protein
MDDAILWPNEDPVVDGIVPVDEVPQDPDLLDIDPPEDLDPLLEMED